MPTYSQTYTTCAGPNDAYPHQRMGGIAGFIISSWYFSGILTIVWTASFIALLIGMVPGGICIAAGILIVALLDVKDWYYNHRLLCIRSNDCAIGSVVAEPTVSFDGDRKLNIVLAPHSDYSPSVLTDHVLENADMLSDPAQFLDGRFPGAPRVDEIRHSYTALREYMESLKGEHPEDEDKASYMYEQVTIGYTSRLLSSPNGNLFGRLYRKDAGTIPDGAVRNVIPVDFDPGVQWDQAGARSNLQAPDPQLGGTSYLNPMFKFGLKDESTNRDELMVPFLHCEIEGYYVARLIDDFVTFFSGFLIGCMIFGPLGGLIIGFLAWLAKKIFDWVTGNDGDAAEPDVDWSDPFYGDDIPPGTTAGSLVAVFGDWIMDTEHHQYFELHPVRAFYYLTRSTTTEWYGAGDVMAVPTETLINAGRPDKLYPEQITPNIAQQVCSYIAGTEKQDREPATKQTTAGAALSHGARTRYA